MKIMTVEEDLKLLSIVSTPIGVPTAWKSVIELMIMQTHDIGVGLAAPQVGIRRRFFIAQLDHPDKTFTACFNPTVIHVQTSSHEPITYISSIEGCLSVPGQQYAVQRALNIRLEYTDIEGKPQTRLLSGFPAMIAQHENDHLDGKLICTIGKLLTQAR